MFDKEKFAKILINIKETYNSQEEFAKKSGVGRTYISQYMNCKIDFPPKPQLLVKISEASKGITTYDELMNICGYINSVGISDINLDSDEMNILSKMLLDYKEFLNTNNSFNKFDEQKYLSHLSKNSREKIIIAFRRNSLDLILNRAKTNNDDDNYFEFASEDDAMFPLLDVGDIALVYKQDYIENGSTLLINIDNHNTIRKFTLSDDKTYYTLSAMNVYYKDINLKITELNKIKILGKVIKSENKSAFK